MKAQLTQLQERIGALHTRERVLLFAAALAVLWVLAELLFLRPIANQQNTLQSQLDQARSALETQQAELNTLTAQTLRYADNPQQAQIKTLQQQIADTQRKLATLTSGMVDAMHLPRILEDVLVKTDNLTLLELTALPVQEIQLAAEAGDGILDAGIYKHPVRLRLEGRFFDVIAYLKALEALPWGFNWDELNYKVTQFPYAEVELQVYTLTTEEGLFGA